MEGSRPELGRMEKWKVVAELSWHANDLLGGGGFDRVLMFGKAWISTL